MSPAANKTQVLAGAISGEGGLAQYGEGVTILSGNNTYIGDTHIQQGTLQGNIPHGSDLTIDAGATYDASSTPGMMRSASSLGVVRAIDELKGSGKITGTGSLSVNSGAFGGVMKHNGVLIKDSHGHLTLSGVNNYAGETRILAGTLSLEGDGTLGQGGLAMSSGSELDLSKMNSDTLDLSGKSLSLSQSAATPGQNSLQPAAPHARIRMAGAPASDSPNTQTLNLQEATLSFTIPSYYNAAHPATLLLVDGGDVDLTNAKVSLNANMQPRNLRPGASVNLVGTTNGGKLTDGGTLHGQRVYASYGAIDYGFTLDANTDNLTACYGSSCTANAGDNTNNINRANDNARAMTYGAAARAALLNDAYDHTLSFIDHWKYSREGRFAPEPGTPAGGFSAFASMQGATSKVKTGSSVNNNGVSFLIGGAFDLTSSYGDTLLGVFAEGGEGSYDAYSSFGNANGDTWHYGIGAFGKHTFTNGFYGEASVRAGRVKADYEGRSGMDYSGQNWYWGAHGGIGYEHRIGKHSILDGYAKLIWTQQESKSVRTNYDEKLSFDQMDSIRSRIGARLIHTTEKGVRWWGGLAYEYEFDGETNASIDGMKIRHDNEMKGHTGMAEGGIEWAANKDWTMNASATGMLGQRRGLVGQLQARYKF
jgi:outer membrane autotransporter protein